MSVVVLGMEMPRDCWGCAMSFDFCCNITGRIWDPDPGQPLRPDWCPLRPLPEKHGRLVDADELEDVFYRFHCQSVGYVQHAETIVEAEGDN